MPTPPRSTERLIQLLDSINPTAIDNDGGAPGEHVADVCREAARHLRVFVGDRDALVRANQVVAARAGQAERDLVNMERGRNHAARLHKDETDRLRAELDDAQVETVGLRREVDRLVGHINDLNEGRAAIEGDLNRAAEDLQAELDVGRATLRAACNDLIQIRVHLGEHFHATGRTGETIAAWVIRLLSEQREALSEAREVARAAREAEQRVNSVLAGSASRYSKLHRVAEALYRAAWWSPDRPCDDNALWTRLREALGLPAGAKTESLGPTRAKIQHRLRADLETAQAEIESLREANSTFASIGVIGHANGGNGCTRIVAERIRQITQEGWSVSHDDEHEDGSLAAAAASYAIIASNPSLNAYTRNTLWPGSWGLQWFKPSADPIRNLERAGALVAAEIDRLIRKQEAEKVVAYDDCCGHLSESFACAECPRVERPAAARPDSDASDPWAPEKLIAVPGHGFLSAEA